MVTQVIQSASNDVYVVEDARNNKEYMIPAVKEFIVHVDIHNKKNSYRSNWRNDRMKIDVLTLFPELFDAFEKWSIVGRTIEKGLLSLNKINIRDFQRININE